MLYQRVGNVLKIVRNVVSIKQHKEAKTNKLHIANIEVILKIVDLSLRGLERYGIYRPVMDILLVLKEQKSILEAHLNKMKQKVDTKV